MNVFKSLGIRNGDNYSKYLLYEKRRSRGNKYLNKLLPQFFSQTMSRPLMIHIETINTCNHDCIFCAQTLNKDRKRVMPMDLFSKFYLIMRILVVGRFHLLLLLGKSS